MGSLWSARSWPASCETGHSHSDAGSPSLSGRSGGAALAGGTVHGFLLVDDDDLGGGGLWAVTLLLLGVSAWAAWALGARLLLAPVAARGLTNSGRPGGPCLRGPGLTRESVVLRGGDPLPSRRPLPLHGPEGRAPRLAALGLGGTFVAAAVHQAGHGIRPVHLDHHPLGHLIEAVALLVFFRGAVRLEAPASS